MTNEQFYALVDQEPLGSSEYLEEITAVDACELRPTAEWMSWLETVHEVMPSRLRERWNGYRDQPADIWLANVLTREAWEHVQSTVPMTAWRSVAYYVHDDYPIYEVGRIDAVNVDLQCTLAVNAGFESPWVCPGQLYIETRIN